MVEVKTKSGFVCEVDENITNDAEALNILSKTYSKNPLKSMLATFDFAETLLGETQLNKLKDFIRLENGRVPFDELVKEIADIIVALGNSGKNS